MGMGGLVISSCLCILAFHNPSLRGDLAPNPRYLSRKSLFPVRMDKFWLMCYLLEMARKTLFRGATIMGFVQEREIGLDSKYNEGKWGFINKEQGGSQWVEIF